MTNKSSHIHDALDGVIAAAVSKALTDRLLAENVTKAVLEAIEAYEDERFLAILQETDDGENVPLETIISALKS